MTLCICDLDCFLIHWHHKHIVYFSGAIGATSLPGRNSLERSSSEDSGMAASPHLDGMLMREIPATFDKIQGENFNLPYTIEMQKTLQRKVENINVLCD